MSVSGQVCVFAVTFDGQLQLLRVISLVGQRETAVPTCVEITSQAVPSPQEHSEWGRAGSESGAGLGRVGEWGWVGPESGPGWAGSESGAGSGRRVGPGWAGSESEAGSGRAGGWARLESGAGEWAGPVSGAGPGRRVFFFFRINELCRG